MTPSPPPEPRRPLVGGNWKMNGSRADAERWSAAAAGAARDHPGVEVVVFPPAVWLEAAAGALRAAGGAAALGGQSCHGDAKGAHTGALAAPMLAEAGCAWVLAGHSEVRREQGQDDARVRASVAAGLAAGLSVLLCVGEDGAERDAGRAREVVARQVDAALAGLAGGDGRLDLAYEPVWAIGTGRNATPEQAAEAHGWVRERLSAAGRPRARILYGGSVSPANIGGFLANPAVDGVLVGGQSLDPAAFAAIVRAAAARGAPAPGRSRT